MRSPILHVSRSLTAILALAPVAVKVHLPFSQTRAFESANGEFILVLLMPEGDRAERREASEYDPRDDGQLSQLDLQEWAERVATQKAIEAKYPQSGLYRNDGSAELIWPSPDVTTCRGVFVANDGRHVVAAKSIGSTCWDSHAPYVFYASGKVLAEHDDYATLPCIWMRLLIAWWTDIELPYDLAMGIDDDAGVFIVETTQYDTLIFELATGRLTAQRSPWPFYLAALALGPPLGLWAWRRRMRRSEAGARGRKGIAFSLREILAFTALIAASLAAARLWGNVAAACAILATSGAFVARIRAGTTAAWFVGALAALYGAYVTLLLCAIIDSALLDGFTLLKLWLDEESSRWMPLGILGTVALATSWLAGRMCAPDGVAKPV